MAEALRLRRPPADDDPFAGLEPGANLAARLVVEPDLHCAAGDTPVGVDHLDGALAVGVGRRERRGRDVTTPLASPSTIRTWAVM